MNLVNSMRRFTIRTRMFGAIAVVLLSLALVGGAGLMGLFGIVALNGDFLEITVVQSTRLSALREEIAAVRNLEKDMLLAYEKPEIAAKIQPRWVSAIGKTRAAADALGSTGHPVASATVAKIKPLLDGYETKATPIVKQLVANAYDSAAVADRMLRNAKADVDAIMPLLAELDQTQAADAEAASANSKYMVTRTIMTFGAALLVAVLILIPLTLLNMVSICRPLDEARRLAMAIAGGDLTHSITVQGRDETAALQEALAEMQSALNRIVARVRMASDSMGTASTEIATGNADLSARTEQTAANLEETASSMEQLTTTVQQTAQAARTANELATSAQTSAAHGGEVVSQVVATMEDISASSAKISDIIGVIDGIAFQTNILALNAAVEAARAGEEGRGFAVVAGEVRGLAQRSAQAAREIKALIAASAGKVESGAKLVVGAGAAMNEIVGSVQRVTQIIGEITSAATAQSDGIAQVNQAVSQLDQMTQQNAALVEESAAAGESLRDQAKALVDVVAEFKLTPQ